MYVDKIDITDILYELYNKCRAADEVWEIIKRKDYNKDWEKDLEVWHEKYSEIDSYGVCIKPDFS